MSPGSAFKGFATPSEGKSVWLSSRDRLYSVISPDRSISQPIIVTNRKQQAINLLAMQVSTGKARQRTNAIQTMAVKSALHTLDLCSGVYGIPTNALPKHLTLSLSLSLSLSLPISCLFTEQSTSINSAFRRK